MDVTRFLAFIAIAFYSTTNIMCLDLDSDSVINLIVDYLEVRQIQSVTVFHPSLVNGHKKLDVIHFTKKLMEFDILVSIHCTTTQILNVLRSDDLHRKAVVVLIDETYLNTTNHVLEQASELSMYGQWSWLLITTTNIHNSTIIINQLKSLNFGLDADIVLAKKYSEDIPVTKNGLPSYVDHTFNFNHTSSNDEENPNTHYKLNTAIHKYELYQIYKIRNWNNSFVNEYLGSWNDENRTKQILPLKKTESRMNMHQFPLFFGRKNASQKLVNTVDENVIEDDNDEYNLVEIMKYITKSVNASYKLVSFPTLGYKDLENKWTDLLGAVVQDEIDLALDTVIQTQERASDMFFTYKIMHSIRNIYVKPKESNEMRDIFLMPFGTRLVMCVLGTSTILAATVVLINHMVIVLKVQQNQQNYPQIELNVSDSIIWCISVLSMQGSVWKPVTCSGNVVVILSLVFALIIFNSYSAFITSILSVEVSNIRSVDDLLASDYKIGYIKSSQDDVYLQSINNTQLQEIYLRGYLDTVGCATDGLLKATEGHYGFFVSGHVARKEFLILSNYKCRYHIKEIPIHATANTIAFPMSPKSPYKRLINISIMKMYETGIFKYVHSQIFPPMPPCDKSSIFHSARLSDLMTAFGILIVGMVLSLIIWIGECAWKGRRKIYVGLKKERNHKILIDWRGFHFRHPVEGFQFTN